MTRIELSTQVKGILPSANGGVPPATAFPVVAPPAGTRLYRTDLSIEYFYDGTRWLSTALYDTALAAIRALSPQSAGGSKWDRAIPFGRVWKLFIVDLYAGAFITAAGNWTISLIWYNASNSAGTTIGTVVLSSVGGGEAVNRAAINAVFDPVNASRLEGALTVNSGSSSIYPMAGFSYRLVG